MNLRKQRGLEIARTQQIQKVKGGWLVPSQSGNGFYKVTHEFDCDCLDCQKKQVICKHAYAVRYYLKKEIEFPKAKIVRGVQFTCRLTTPANRLDFSMGWAIKHFNRLLLAERTIPN